MAKKILADVTASGNVSAAKGLVLPGTFAPITANGITGNVGQVLTSAGNTSTPYWSTPAGYSFRYEQGSPTYLDDSTTAYRPMTGDKAVTLTPGVYQFSGTFYVQAQFFPTSASWISNFQFLYTTLTGTNAINNIQYDWHIGSNTTSLATAVTPTVLYANTNTARVLSTTLSTGSRYIILKLSGIVRISGDGTGKFAPAANLNLAQQLGNQVIIHTGSNFQMQNIGTYSASTDIAIGTWV